MRFAALDVPVFRWYWVTSWISSTGDGMENVIRNVLVYQLAGDSAPFWLGMMVFAHWVPFTAFSLYGGVLADRYDNRKVQIVAQLLLMTAAVGVALATIGRHGGCSGCCCCMVSRARSVVRRTIR